MSACFVRTLFCPAHFRNRGAVPECRPGPTAAVGCEFLPEVGSQLVSKSTRPQFNSLELVRI